MKKTSKDTGATEKTKTDYFQIARTSDPIESYGTKKFRKRTVAERKEKNQKQKARDNARGQFQISSFKFLIPSC